MVKLGVAILAASGMLAAQNPGFISIYVPPVSDQLKAFLELTETQATQIAAVNSDFAKWTQVRVERQAQLEQEITVETAKPALDPMALGVRYAELETIRREIAGETVKVRAQAIAVLKDVQQQKLQVLDLAMRLGAEIQDGQCQNLLEPMPPVVITRGDTSSSSGGFGNAISATLGGCGVHWFSTSGFRGVPSRTAQTRAGKD